jgi:putative intracellular protease/amidase/YHS domain-containing protein
MNRRDLLKRSATLGLAAAIPSLASSKLFSGSGLAKAGSSPDDSKAAERPNPLVPPAQGSIPVAFVISNGAVIIDFCGPWEVFENVMISGRMDLFHLYTVAETTKPIIASGGMQIVPDYTFETAPAPKLVVIPAQNDASPAMLEWIRKSAKTADVTMSVCTGAFVLAETGLLSGKAATTHHGAYGDFSVQFPDIQLKRGARFVEAGNLASAGGLSSGIDLALRVVERYYGREVGEKTAYAMEYQGQGWLDPNSNQVYAKLPLSTEAHPICPVCGMDGNREIKSVYKGKTYYFCMESHKKMFDQAPDKFVNAA